MSSIVNWEDAFVLGYTFNTIDDMIAKYIEFIKFSEKYHENSEELACITILQKFPVNFLNTLKRKTNVPSKHDLFAMQYMINNNSNISTAHVYSRIMEVYKNRKVKFI